MYNEPIHFHESPSITIRLAGDGEEAELRRLAGLDSRRLPAAPLLVASVGSRARAAISLSSGETIADPFHPTAELLSMLEIRRATRRYSPAWKARLSRPKVISSTDYSVAGRLVWRRSRPAASFPLAPAPSRSRPAAASTSPPPRP